MTPVLIQKMPDLYGITRDLVDFVYQEEDYLPWNNLAHHLTLFIFNKFAQDDLMHKVFWDPFIPKKESNTEWSKWFYSVQKALLIDYDDATPERVFRCMQDPPAESITMTLFSVTPLEIIHEFIDTVEFGNELQPISTN